MQIIRSPKSFSREPLGDLIARSEVGVTIGNFDGLHLGHQELFSALDEALKVKATFSGKPPFKVLLSFFPHPRRFLSGVKRSELPFRPEFFTLTSLRQKFSLLTAEQFAACYLLRFNQKFASLTPDEFLQEYLFAPLRPSVVVIGDDWAFGKNRSGNPETLRVFGAAHGFEVKVVKAVSDGAQRVSSTQVKQALSAADFDRLRILLGRNYTLEGHVRHGDKRGRELGFPTANLEFHTQLTPPNGIYASYAHVGGERIPAATYIGNRPTFGEGRKLVEIHLLDDKPHAIYAKRLVVEFVQKVRDDERFESAEKLVDAIRRDIESVRGILSKKDAERGHRT